MGPSGNKSLRGAQMVWDRRRVALTALGAAVVVDFHLKIASASELVEVNAEPPV